MVSLWKKIVLLLILSATLNISPQIIYFPSKGRLRTREMISLENDKFTMDLIMTNEEKKFAELISINMFIRVQDARFVS